MKEAEAPCPREKNSVRKVIEWYTDNAIKDYRVFYKALGLKIRFYLEEEDEYALTDEEETV